MLVITVSVEKRYGPSGATTVRFSSRAATIREAVERYGPDARLVVPIEPEGFFALTDAQGSIAEPESVQLTPPTEGPAA
jgi:hypothetical protein